MCPTTNHFVEDACTAVTARDFDRADQRVRSHIDEARQARLRAANVD